MANSDQGGSLLFVAEGGGTGENQGMLHCKIDSVPAVAEF